MFTAKRQHNVSMNEAHNLSHNVSLRYFRLSHSELWMCECTVLAFIYTLHCGEQLIYFSN